MANEYTADEGYEDRVLFSTLRWSLSRLPVIVLLAIVVLVCAAFCALIVHPAWLGGVIGAGVGVVVVLLFAGLSFRAMRARIWTMTRPGGTFSSILGDATLTLTSPVTTTDEPYEAYDELQFRDGLAYLRLRGSAIFMVFPGELFPEAERPAILARIGRNEPSVPHD